MPLLGSSFMLVAKLCHQMGKSPLSLLSWIFCCCVPLVFVEPFFLWKVLRSVQTPLAHSTSSSFLVGLFGGETEASCIAYWQFLFMSLLLKNVKQCLILFIKIMHSNSLWLKGYTGLSPSLFTSLQFNLVTIISFGTDISEQDFWVRRDMGRPTNKNYEIRATEIQCLYILQHFNSLINPFNIRHHKIIPEDHGLTEILFAGLKNVYVF